MENANVKPNVETITHLINGFSRLNQPEVLEIVRNFLEIYKVQPNLNYFNALIRAYGFSGNETKMLSVFEEMKIAKIDPGNVGNAR